MPSKKRKRGRMVNTDYSDQEDIPEAEAYSPASNVSPEHGDEILVGYVRRLLTTELRLAVRMGDEFRKRLLRAYNDGDSMADVAARFH
ncbi:hypothetical protein T10_4944 [Trichinella papuae]|uniref:Uncharacterized protein n=1 Tax=Trichinella papuae TaxID=268474 RepID=A0A0V1MTV3_9BILA|nr:hypothetical protein T10_4944 [Trichinella papuae]